MLMSQKEPSSVELAAASADGRWPHCVTIIKALGFAMHGLEVSWNCPSNQQPNTESVKAPRHETS